VDLHFLLYLAVLSLRIDKSQPFLRLEDHGLRPECDMEGTEPTLKLFASAAVQEDSQ